MQGVLFLVVGPSGVGKDTLIDGARAALTGDPHFAFARRTITRPHDAGGEAHEAISRADFEAAEAAGAFVVTWRAHALAYGIRTSELKPLAEGRNVLVNASRRAIGDFSALGHQCVILSVTAPPELVRQRLEARGREDAAAVAARLQREVALPAAARTIEVVNDGAVEVGVARFVSALVGAGRLALQLTPLPIELFAEPLCAIHREARPVAAQGLFDAAMVEVLADGRSARARLALASGDDLLGRHQLALSARAREALGVPLGSPVEVRRSPSPKSRDVLRKKIAGAELSAAELARVVRDMAEGRYSQGEIAGFLVAASNRLSLAEIVALTRVRADYFERFDWSGRVVVDKHSMGGIPGSRITMIAVPIAAAHGLIVPKTSSRAITSAAGTADVMECAARVDLNHAELRRAVEAAGASIAWSGRVSHSAVDDVMNAINRPLGIRSAALDVSSILSKKLAVGSTHAVIDIPVGPWAKTCTLSEGTALAELFAKVGEGVGLTVRALLTDGSQPVGSAVGPALELCDVEGVLYGAAGASQGLRAKALRFAATMIGWDDAFEGDAHAEAEKLLASGAAAEAFGRIRAAQGEQGPVRPGGFRATVRAERGGRISAVNGFAIAEIARAAGAPGDKAAGVRLLAGLDEEVREGAPIMEVVASTDTGLAQAREVDVTAFAIV